MTSSIDGFIRDWGESVGWSEIKGRRRRGQNVKNALGGGSRNTPIKRPSKRALSVQQGFVRTVRRVPEVMVKISGGGRNIRRIKAHFDYISRNGDVDLENENGEIFSGRDDLLELRDMWANSRYCISDDEERRREAFNIILSMPPGTDRRSVTEAAREFAADQFENHQYVLATHEDEKHPHVHLSVKAVDKYGSRLNPRKADLQNWREVFAEKLRDNGIEANATRRKARGVVRKAQKQAVKHIDRGYKAGKRKSPSRATRGQLEDVYKETKKGESKANPAHDAIDASREKVTRAYGGVARELAASQKDSDKKLALDTVRFVQQMPPVETKHELQVSQGRSQAEKPDKMHEREIEKGDRER